MQNLKQTLRRASALTVVFVMLAGLPVAGANELRAKGQTLYVPIYSHIYGGDREQPFLLTATLSIRNSDPVHVITVTVVDYYDSEGKLVRHYLQRPVTLKPLSSARYVVAESDKLGGSGASFLVKWNAAAPVSRPVVEGVMIGTKMQQGISFTSRGQVIEEQTE